MKQLLTFLIVLTIHSLSFTQELKEDYQEEILRFVNSIKEENTDEFIALVRFPLKRAYPLSDVKNETELVNRYKEIFDDSLIKMIIASDSKNDWSSVGWRGVMFNHGMLWLDIEGKLIVLNYQSYYAVGQ